MYNESFSNYERKEPINVLFKQLDMFFKENNYNFKKYTENGYKIHFNFVNGRIEVIYNKKKYILKVIDDNDDFYWYLTPYKDPSFKTKIDTGKSDLDYVLLSKTMINYMYNERTIYYVIK